MSIWRLITNSLWHHRRINFAVALGVAAATAVLTGAMIVGTSMRLSLRGITLERLGHLNLSLVSPRFFSEELVEQVRESKTFGAEYDRATGLVYFPSATIETAGEGPRRRAGSVQTLGVGEGIELFDARSVLGDDIPTGDEVVINQSLAEDLGITAEDVEAGEVLLTLRLPKPSAVPEDSPLGDRSDLILNLPRLRLVKIIPDEGLGRFGLQPTQLTPRNALVALDRVQSSLDEPGRVNAMWVGKSSVDAVASVEAAGELSNELRPSFEDYGLLLKRVTQRGPDGEVVFDYYSVASREMVINDELADAVSGSLEGLSYQPIMTYLANDMDTIDGGEVPGGADGVPYSMVAGIDFGEGFAPQSSVTGEPITSLNDDEIVLNSVAAQWLGASQGELLRMTYVLPETTHGDADESFHDFTIRDVARLVEPATPFTRRREATFDERPTLANDPDLTPEVPGVTDQESVANWNLSFLDDTRIDSDDDEYWNNYRTTPKAFITLAAAQSLWRSRFGQVTSFRIPADQISEESLRERIEKRLHESNESFGFELVDVKREGLQASAGTTPFDGLFMGLSLFIIVSALMLVVLLFRLGLEQRASEAGLLLAVGFANRRVAWLLGLEGLGVAVLGGLVGALIGVAYAGVMIWGLKTVWVGAIRTPFIDLHVTPLTLITGWLISVVVCGATIAWTVFRFRPGSVRNLLAGRVRDALGVGSGPRRRWLWIGLVSGVCALGTIGGAASVSLSAQAQAGAFMGGGCLLLVALLSWVTLLLQRLGVGGAGRLDLPSLAVRNAARNSTRSTLMIGLVAVASFLVGSMSAFQMEPSESGTGGFDLMATTSRPIFVDLGDPADRAESLVDEDGVLEGLEVLSFRVRLGGDASCNNPYQVAQPRILGVSAEVESELNRAQPGLAFAGVLNEGSDGEGEEGELAESPWSILRRADRETTEDGREIIPVILDQNTAMWSLKVYQLGQVFELEYDGVGKLAFRPVGFLSNTILQGSLLMGEDDFKRVFPEVSGTQFFLIRSGGKGEAEVGRVREVLEDGLGEYGMMTESSRGVLADLLAVQNTYLKAFQSLGALGLLLGTFGLATVQVRNVIERRGELGLMQALGFERRRLRQLVLFENGVLLLGGVGVGSLAALAVVLPHMLVGDASVPWGMLGMMLLVILVVGWIAGWFSIRATLSTTIQAALRRE